MNKRHIKLIMELIFIFIIPLLFICFTSEIQVERNFEYDNNGNYQETEKHIEFTVPFLYTKTLFNSKSFNNLLETNYINNNEIGNFYYKWDSKRLPEIIYINSEYNYNDPIIELTLLSYNNGKFFISIYLDDDLIIKYDIENSDNQDYEELIGSYLENETINGIEYCKYQLLNKEFTYNFYQETSYFIEDDNYYYYETINTIWGNIKQLLIENLDLNDNILLDIVLCYMILWVINWIIWHIFYGFLELIIHIIPRKWEKE